MGARTLLTKYQSRFAKSEEGAVAIIVALLLVVLMGFVALGVDTASLYRDRAQLQSVSDLTAMSAVALPDEANARAIHTMGRNDKIASDLESLQVGRFLRNPAIPPQNRFTELSPGNPKINAVRVVLNDDAPLHFARIFTDDSHVALDRNALASRTGSISYSLSSHLVSLGDVALSEALTQRFGGGASIGAGDNQALANVDIDLGALLEALDAQIGGTSRNPAEILNTTTTAGDIITALQSILPASLANSLSGLANAAGSASFDVSSLVGGIDTELGLTATDFLSEIDISALDVVKSLVAATSSDQGVGLAANVNVADVISANTTLTAGEPPAQSGTIALGEESVLLHRAAARLKSEITIEPNVLENLGLGVQVASVHLPIFVEVAGSTARLDRMACHITSPQGVAAKFRTAHTPLDPANGTSVAALYLGELDEAALGNGPINPADLEFTDLLSVNVVIEGGFLLPDTTIAGITIQARSAVAVGESKDETISFTHAEIAAGQTTKSFGSGNLLGSAVSDLLSPQNTELRVKPGQGGLISSLAAPVISTLLAVLPDSLLTGLLSPVDGILDAALDAVGVKLGAGELTVTGHHCEPIRLVR
jgi:uncharacterized membrane protein